MEEVEAELIPLKPDLEEGLTTKLVQKAKAIENKKLPHLCNQKDASYALLRNHFDKMEMQLSAAQCNMCKKDKMEVYNLLGVLLCVFRCSMEWSILLQKVSLSGLQ